MAGPHGRVVAGIREHVADHQGGPVHGPRRGEGLGGALLAQLDRVAEHRVVAAPAGLTLLRVADRVGGLQQVAALDLELLDVVDLTPLEQVLGPGISRLATALHVLGREGVAVEPFRHRPATVEPEPASHVMVSGGDPTVSLSSPIRSSHSAARTSSRSSS